MPTYGYRCNVCNGEFDVWQKMTDDAVAACPTCGGASRRLFFPAGIVFKGSGFYATDSRKASTASSTPSSNGSGDTGGSSSKSSTSSDTGSSTKSGGSSASTSSD